MYQPFHLPTGFLFGTATAALQVEGGDTGNTWYRWAEHGRIKDGSHCKVAADHWNRVDEDIEMMHGLNMQLYRMGLEWSRIEPEPGSFDEAAIAHYRYELQQLHLAGIRPMVTLHHFSHPLWFENSGGWEREDSPELFARFVRHVAQTIGDLVPDWITINEPNVFLVQGYIFGEWPPGYRSVSKYFRVARHMISAHHRTYAELHRAAATAGRECNVGAAHHIRVFDPLRPKHPLDRFVTALYRSEFQWLFVNGMTRGKLSFPVRPNRAYRDALSDALNEAPRQGFVSDFVGVNYYSRDMLSFTPNPGIAFGKVHVNGANPVNDLGWEIYPEGLLRVLREVGKRYPLPIYITENGTCDAADRFRARFIVEHLAAISEAISEDIDVRRYYHWSLLDNFEWLEGLSIRFGLVHVDYGTQKRTLRESAKLYAEIAKERGLTQQMIERYL